MYKKILVVVLLIFKGIVSGQNAADIDEAFNIGSGFNSSVNAIAIQSDNKILVGGSFTNYKGVVSNNIVRLNENGSIDSSFNIGNGFNGNGSDYNGFSGSVNAIVIQNDGKILIGFGRYSQTPIFTYNDINVSGGIIRLNTDGSIDSSFSFLGGNIRNLALQPDGKILYIGDSLEFKRLNSDGSIDTTFDTGTGFQPKRNQNASLKDIIIDSSGKILVGGIFQSFNGINKGGLVRLNTNGTIDNSFGSSESGFVFTIGMVNTIKIQSDGKIVVGGGFSSFNGNVKYNKLIRLNSNGSLDYTFISPNLVTDRVNTIALKSNGKILIGGNWDGTCKQFNDNGTEDISFNTGIGFSGLLNNPINIGIIKLQSDGKILVGGGFVSYQGSSTNHLIRLKGDNSLSTNNFSKNKLLIYPNPINETLHFSLLENEIVNEYEIYNLLGKKIISNKLIENQIDVSYLSKGVYLLKLQTNGGVLNSKFIKE